MPSPDADKRLVAVFGGTFDPVHLGHLAIAATARAMPGIDALVLVPAASPPLRDAPTASFMDRVAMLRAATRGLDYVIDLRESLRAQPSFTHDTLQELRADAGAQTVFAWVVGIDAFARVKRWHRYPEVLDLAHWLVFDRPGSANEMTMAQVLGAEWPQRKAANVAELRALAGGKIVAVHGPQVDVSATEIRRLCAAGASAARLLPAEVWAYICARGLYGASARNASPA